MEVDQDRSVVRCVAAAVEVEQIAAPGVPVANVGDPLHAARSQEARWWQQQDAGPGPVAARRRLHVLPPAGPQPFPEGLPDGPVRPHAAPRGDCQPDDGGGGHPDHRPGARRPQVTLGRGECGGGHEGVYGHERQLVGEQTEDEAHARHRAGPTRGDNGEEGAPGDERHGDQIADGHETSKDVDPDRRSQPHACERRAAGVTWSRAAAPAVTLSSLVRLDARIRRYVSSRRSMAEEPTQCQDETFRLVRLC